MAASVIEAVISSQSSATLQAMEAEGEVFFFLIFFFGVEQEKHNRSGACMHPVCVCVGSWREGWKLHGWT